MKSIGLVKFKRTGNIYYACYNGTTDIMLPFICTPKECYDEKLGFYCPIECCQQREDVNLPNDIADLDEIEIYSDYGDGFYWKGIGSESIKMIKNYLNPFDELKDEDVTDGKPQWVKDFFANEEE